MSNLSTFSNLNLLPSYRIFDDFDSLFDSFLSDRRNGSRAHMSTPRVNVEETPGGYDIHMAAPGLSRNDFKIHADGGYLTVSVDHKTTEESKTKWLTREYSYSSFSRSWKLPASVDASSIGARYEAGILTVSVPSSNKKSTKVEIRVE